MSTLVTSQRCSAVCCAAKCRHALPRSAAAAASSGSIESLRLAIRAASVRTASARMAPNAALRWCGHMTHAASSTRFWCESGTMRRCTMSRSEASRPTASSLDGLLVRTASASWNSVSGAYGAYWASGGGQKPTIRSCNSPSKPGFTPRTWVKSCCSMLPTAGGGRAVSSGGRTGKILTTY